MKKTTVEAFNIIGIAVRTHNNDGQGIKDIGALWGRIQSEDIVNKIPNKLDQNIYSVYTDYEGDYTQPYTTLIGCKVASLETIPDGMMGKAFEGGAYTEFEFKGTVNHELVGAAWGQIYAADIQRSYTADFELYDAKTQHPTDAGISIFIATKG